MILYYRLLGVSRMVDVVVIKCAYRELVWCYYFDHYDGNFIVEDCFCFIVEAYLVLLDEE